MGLVSSSFALETVVQPDGSRWCTETHVLSGGVIRACQYLSASGLDNAAIMAGRGAVIAELIRRQEIIDAVLVDAPVALIQQTITQFLVDLRARYKASEKAEACYLAWWLLRRIADGSITDAQCAAAFGLTAPQWTNAKTNTLSPRSANYAGSIAATGV